MTIRILCIVAALIAAVWISYKIELSRGWTVFFTLLVSAAVGFLATITPLNYDEYVTTVKSYQTRVVSRYLAERIKPPVMMATIVPAVTPVRTGYRPDCYVSVYNYNCANRIDLRDSNIFTQYKLLEEALNSKTPKEEL